MAFLHCNSKSQCIVIGTNASIFGGEIKYVKICKHNEDERASTATAVRSHQNKSGSSTYGVGLIKKK